MRKNFTEDEFTAWKEEWFKEKGCPFFACSQALFRKVCGRTFICGCLFDYSGYLKDKWIKECDVKLSQDDENKFPTKSCPACTGSMSLKAEPNSGLLYSDSWCPVINNWYEEKGIKVIRGNEKYCTAWGVYILPLIGEEAYLELLKDPKKLQDFLDNPKKYESE